MGTATLAREPFMEAVAAARPRGEMAGEPGRVVCLHHRQPTCPQSWKETASRCRPRGRAKTATYTRRTGRKGRTEPKGFDFANDRAKELVNDTTKTKVAGL